MDLLGKDKDHDSVEELSISGLFKPFLNVLILIIYLSDSELASMNKTSSSSAAVLTKVFWVKWSYFIKVLNFFGSVRSSRKGVTIFVLVLVCLSGSGFSAYSSDRRNLKYFVLFYSERNKDLTKNLSWNYSFWMEISLRRKWVFRKTTLLSLTFTCKVALLFSSLVWCLIKHRSADLQTMDHHFILKSGIRQRNIYIIYHLVGLVNGDTNTRNSERSEQSDKRRFWSIEEVKLVISDYLDRMTERSPSCLVWPRFSMWQTFKNAALVFSVRKFRTDLEVIMTPRYRHLNILNIRTSGRSSALLF